MDKTQRQLNLIHLLKNTHLPISVITIAHEFNCTQKTIRRDIEQLRNQRNAPWFISANLIHRDKSWQHPIELQGYWFDKKEIESLFALNQIIQQLSSSGLKQQLEPFQRRINELLTKEISPHQNPLTSKVKIIEIAERPVAVNVFETAVQALAENKQIHIHFWNRHTNQHTQRTLSPQQLIRYKDNWLIDAYCHLRKALRSFSLEAITQIQLRAETSVVIPPNELQDHYQSAYGIYAGKANNTAILQFSAYRSRWIQSEQWHPKQTLQLNELGELIMTLPYNEDEELIQEILRYGPDVTVLKPERLKQKIIEKLKQTLTCYCRDKF